VASFVDGQWLKAMWRLKLAHNSTSIDYIMTKRKVCGAYIPVREFINYKRHSLLSSVSCMYKVIVVVHRCTRLVDS
jgi:hypothetical protein